MQAEEAALLAVDMAAAERRIHSALNAHISELRQQIESEERAELSKQIKLQVSPNIYSTAFVCYFVAPHITMFTVVCKPATDCHQLLC